MKTLRGVLEFIGAFVLLFGILFYLEKILA